MKIGIKKLVKSKVKYWKIYQDYKVKKNLYYRGQKRIVYRNSTKSHQFIDLFNKIKFPNDFEGRFFHYIDTGLFFYTENTVIGNIPPDYSLIIDNSINDLIDYSEKYSNNEIAKMLYSVKEYILKIADYILLSNNINKEIINSYFVNMIDSKAKTLEEALQRILFWSSLFWQTGHRLVGLGRLDKILDKFANDQVIDEQVIIIEDFLREFHKYYDFKSNNLPGDIGQIIIIGGKALDNNYFCNQLSYALIRAVKNVKQSDPKILLRVSKNTPYDLMKFATETIATGIGSPLLSNDDIVINCLKDFGYEDFDAYNYVTSACWEPVSYGNSLEQNNIHELNFASCISDTICDCKNNIKCFEDFFDLYLKNLMTQLKKIFNDLDSIDWEEDLLFSLFTKDCLEKNIDIANGGAKYNDYGILSVGFSSAVDSLMNIKKYAFEENKYDITYLCSIWSNNDINKINSITDELKENSKTFGREDNDCIELSNKILNFVSNRIKNYRNKFGGKCKFGLSSPNYLDTGRRTKTTFDGRKNGEPLATNISVSSPIPFTEFINFVSRLEYNGYNCNGNVVDYFISPNMINDNIDTFTNLFFNCIKAGFFQMQLNVINSDKLIDAKRHPENHKDLIVRVWGFSAYFNDLSDDYKNILIKRCLITEGKDIKEFESDK